MRSLVVIILFAPASQGQTREENANPTEGSVDKLANGLLDRAPTARPLRHADLEQTTVGKAALPRSPQTDGGTRISHDAAFFISNTNVRAEVMRRYRDTGVHSWNHQPPNPSRPNQINAALASEAPGVAAGETKLETDTSLILRSGVWLLPHPDKAAKGGEDAYFIRDDKNCIGVADGVGGWASKGVDPGIFARRLMSSARSACDKQLSVQRLVEGPSREKSVLPWPLSKFAEAAGVADAAEVAEVAEVAKVVEDAEDPGGPDPVAIMDQGHKGTDGLYGSATACVLCLQSAKNKLRAANLGDSGFLVIRDGTEVMMSYPKQLKWNCPYQLATYKDSQTKAIDSDVFNVDVRVGDVIVLGTDGVFDNLYTSEIVDVVASARKVSASPTQMAKSIAVLARRRSEDPTWFSPFAQEAGKNGKEFIGGKLDDITVLVSFVDDIAKEPEPTSYLLPRGWAYTTHSVETIIKQSEH